MRHNFDVSALDLALYLVVDPALCDGRMPRDVVEAAVVGGATLVQLRDKQGSTRALLEEARRLKAWLAPRGVPLLVNDRTDVALAAEADGVHLGQEDMPPADARRLLGPNAIIGLTVRSPDEARAVPRELIDYVSIGGVFPTASKNNPALPNGLVGLRHIASLIDLPRVAISGIDRSNAADVVQAGVDGIAVISAICGAPDPQAASAELLATVRETLAHEAHR